MRAANILKNQFITKSIEEIGSEMLSTIAFGLDYRTLNTLTFLREKKEETTAALAELLEKTNLTASNKETILLAATPLSPDHSATFEYSGSLLLSDTFNTELSELHKKIKETETLLSKTCSDRNETDVLEETLKADNKKFENVCTTLNTSSEDAKAILELEDQLKMIDSELARNEDYFKTVFENARNYFLQVLETPKSSLNELKKARENLEKATQALSNANLDSDEVDMEVLCDEQESTLHTLKTLLNEQSNNIDDLLTTAKEIETADRKLSPWQKNIFQDYFAETATATIINFLNLIEEADIEIKANNFESPQKKNVVLKKREEAVNHLKALLNMSTITAEDLKKQREDTLATLESIGGFDDDKALTKQDIDLIKKVMNKLAILRRCTPSNYEKLLIAEANELVKQGSDFSAWQKKFNDDYLVQLFLAQTDDTALNQAKFLAYVIKKGSEFLPKKYIKWGSSIPAAQKFPSSGYEHDIHASGYAHFQPCTGNYEPTNKRSGLLASCAPPEAKKTAGTAEETILQMNHDRLQTFLEMLFDENVEHIIELGADKNKIRLNYRSVKTGKLTSEFDQKENILYLTNNETHITKAIHFLHIPVDDQKPLNLKNQELIAVVDFHKKYKQGVVLAHCDSGVGRTGQTALLLAMQSYLSNNAKTNQKVLQLIDSLINNSPTDEIETEKLIRQLYKAMGRILNQLRKIRFSVEQPEQFLNSFVQTLLLSATEKKEYSHSQIDRLRSTLSDFKPTCFTEAHKASPRSSDNPLRALEEDRNETTPVSLYQSSSGDDSVRSVTPSQLELAEHDASALYAELSSPTTTSPKSPTFFTRLKSESYLDKADTVSSDEIYNSSSDIEGEKTERTTEKEAMRHEELDLVFDSPEEDFPSPELPLSPKLTKQPLFKPTPPPTASQQKPGAQIRTTLGFARQ